jgi:hypothetical protein
MSGGGKGGSTTSETKIPKWLEDAAKKNLAKADAVSELGYMPYYGPDVAAFSPTQEAAWANTNQAANAFGTAAPVSSGMPAANTYAGGVTGYGSSGLYDQAISEFISKNPAQAAAMARLFIDPQGAPAAPAPAAGGKGGTGGTQPYGTDVNGQRASDNYDPFGNVASSGTGSGFSSNYASQIGSYLPGGVNSFTLGSPIDNGIVWAGDNLFGDRRSDHSDGGSGSVATSPRPKADPRY